MGTETALGNKQGSRAAFAIINPSVYLLQQEQAMDLPWNPQCHHPSQTSLMTVRESLIEAETEEI